MQTALSSCCYPEGCAAPGCVRCQRNARGPLSKLERTPPQRKINVTSKSPVGDISVVTLIRTDTTLDHSQKAEKVCSLAAAGAHSSIAAVSLCVPLSAGPTLMFVNIGRALLSTLTTPCGALACASQARQNVSRIQLLADSRVLLWIDLLAVVVSARHFGRAV